MSRNGLIKMIKDLWREYRTFGEPELAKLKREAAKLKLELEQLKDSRARHARLEEQVTLQQLHQSLQSLTRSEDALKSQQAAMAKALDSAKDHAEAELDRQTSAEAQQHIEQVLSAIDLDKYIQEGASLPASLKGVSPHSQKFSQAADGAAPNASAPTPNKRKEKMPPDWDDSAR